ncbi:hypothetical protein D3C87_2034320 [compost metagenome]
MPDRQQCNVVAQRQLLYLLQLFGIDDHGYRLEFGNGPDNLGITRAYSLIIVWKHH